MKDAIIRFSQNVLLTTGLTILLLACVAFFFGGTCIFVKTVFQGLAANVCFHLAFFFTSKVESKYFLLNSILDLSAIMGIAFVFGRVFDWFSSTPPKVLAFMVIATYVISSLFKVFRVNDDIRLINEKLEERRKNKQN